MGDEPLRVVGYCRVSTAEQARDGVSLLSQAERIRGYCRLYGLDLMCVLSDPGESGANLDRPALQEALTHLDCERAGGLVIAKLDRLTRSIVDWSYLIDRYFGDARPCRLFSVGDSIDTRTAGSRMVLNILMSVAQAERERIVERTLEAIETKRAAGERLGTVPYGWRLAGDGRTLEEDPTEQVCLHAMAAWRHVDGWSLREIAEALTLKGVPTKTGRRVWSPSAVASILGRRKGAA
jgi:site-specific DNA recombinase